MVLRPCWDTESGPATHVPRSCQTLAFQQSCRKLIRYPASRECCHSQARGPDWSFIIPLHGVPYELTDAELFLQHVGHLLLDYSATLEQAMQESNSPQFACL